MEASIKRVIINGVKNRDLHISLNSENEIQIVGDTDVYILSKKQAVLLVAIASAMVEEIDNIEMNQQSEDDFN